MNDVYEWKETLRFISKPVSIAFVVIILDVLGYKYFQVMVILGFILALYDSTLEYLKRRKGSAVHRVAYWKVFVYNLFLSAVSVTLILLIRELFLLCF